MSQPRIALPRRELGLFIAVVLLWGLNWPMMKMALGELNLWVFRAWCIASGLFWFLGYCWLKRVPLAIPRPYWKLTVLCALCNVFGWNVLSAAGLGLLPAGRAGLLAYTMPLWVVLLSRYVLGDQLTPRRLLALGLGMVGIALLLIDEVHTLSRAPIGALLMIASGFVWAIGIVLTKRLPASVPSTSFLAWNFIIGGSPILAIGFLGGLGPLLPTGVGAWSGLLFNVIIVFGFCWFAWNELVRALPAAINSISSLLVPLVGFLSGIVILGEQPRSYDYLALVAIIGGVALVLRPERPRLSTSPDTPRRQSTDSAP